MEIIAGSRVRVDVMGMKADGTTAYLPAGTQVAWAVEGDIGVVIPSSFDPITFQPYAVLHVGTDAAGRTGRVTATATVNGSALTGSSEDVVVVGGIPPVEFVGLELTFLTPVPPL